MRKKLVVMGMTLACGVLLGTMVNAEASEAAKKYTITKKTQPCNTSYRKLGSYNGKTKNYYTIKSYLEKLKAEGGGTLVLKKGTYKVCSTLTVPSNVTIQLKNGVKIKKTNVTGSKSLKATKTLFKLSNTKVKKYKGTKKVTITSAKKATIDLGKIKNAVAIDLGRNKNVTISKLTFTGKKGGTYINIAASKGVKVEKCTFKNGVTTTGDKYETAITVNSIGSTPSANVKILSNTFTGLENGVASTVYKKSVYTTGVSIKNNTFTNMSNAAVLAKMWSGASITSNTVSRNDNTNNTSGAFKLYSVTEPEVTGNTIRNCDFAISIGKVSDVSNSISATQKANMQNNTVTNVNHYYVPYVNGTTTRWFYFQNKNDKDFVITPTTGPYHEKYEDTSDYTANNSEAKTYFILRSYMEQLEYAGGGTITLAPGTYELSHSVCIPSNVTVTLSDGVIVKKRAATDTDMATNKAMFEIVPPSKEAVKNSIGGYNGSQNVVIQGQGSSIIDCNNIVSAMGVVMGHAQNVTIRNIAFLNDHGSHFIEMNSSKNVIVDGCSFTDFKIYDNKSHKEAINIDTPDSNNNGFSYEWSTHDRTPCNTVTINNCMFTNVGVAVGSHTYSVSEVGQQIYHENVTIQNCQTSSTYNAAIRMFNWKNAIIKDNKFHGVQGLDDGLRTAAGKVKTYVCIYARGVVNPTITGNSFNKGTRADGTIKRSCAVRIDMVTAASVAGAVNAGYPNTISEISEQNLIDLKNNTIDESCYKYFRVVNEDGSDKPKAECMFNNASAGADGDDTSQGETAAEE